MSAAELDGMIAALRSCAGDDLEAAIARRAAPMLDAAVKKTARAGQAPDGTPWARSKTGGKAVLAHAAEHIQTHASGNLVRQTLTGPDAFHHLGATPGGIRRQVIPDAGAAVPAFVGDIIEQAAREELAARLGGAA